MLEKKRPGVVARLGRAVRRAPGTTGSTPDRLTRAGAVLVLGCLLVALVGLVGGIHRTDALTDAHDRAARLTDDAAVIYSSLAEADADATNGYVSGGVDPPAVRQDYDRAVTRASQTLADAANRLSTGDAGAPELAAIATALPAYTGTVETARAFNRQGLPLGRTYLAEGSMQMSREILPAAARLRTVGVTALTADVDGGGRAPIAVVLLGIGVVGGVVDLSLREARRTRRVVSPGLLAAGGLVIAGLLWWGVVGAVSGAALGRASEHADALGSLDDAQAAALRARSAEGLALATRNGAGDQNVTARLDDLLGTPAAPGMLASAAGHGVDVTVVRRDAQEWRNAHRGVALADGAGDYAVAVASVTGAPGGSGERFAALDRDLDAVVARERDAFAGDLASARGVQTGLAVAPTVLFVLAGAAAALAVVERVREYR